MVIVQIGPWWLSIVPNQLREWLSTLISVNVAREIFSLSTFSTVKDSNKSQLRQQGRCNHGNATLPLNDFVHL